MSTSRIILIIVITIGVIWFYNKKNNMNGMREVERISPSNKDLLSEDKFVGFVSKKDLDTTVDAIVKDLPQEATEALPENLVNHVESLPLSVEEMKEMAALLSTQSSLGTLGVPTMKFLGRSQMEIDAPVAEKQRQEVGKLKVLEQQISDAALVDEVKREEKIRILEKESSSLESQKENIEDKALEIEEEAKTKKEDLVNIHVQKVTSLDQKHKDEELKTNLSHESELKDTTKELEGFAVDKLSMIKSKALVELESMKDAHKEEQRLHKEKYKEIELANERSIEYARTQEERQRIEEKLLSDNKEGVQNLKKLIEEQERKESMFKEKSDELFNKEQKNLLEKVSSITAKKVALQKEEKKILKEKQVDEIEKKNKEHELNVKLLEQKFEKHKSSIMEASKNVISRIKEVDKMKETISKSYGKIIHPRTDKKSRVSSETVENSNGSDSFVLKIPSDLEPGKSDHVKLTISKETKYILELYRNILNKIKKERTLNNVTDEEKETIALAGREFENIKKDYVDKRSQQIERTKNVLGSRI